MTQNATLVLSIALPEYAVDCEPDYPTLGRKLDSLIENHFAGRRMALRAIGMIDHPELRMDDLAEKILEIGTDAYDPQRAGVHEEMYRGFDIHLHATPCIVAEGRLRSPHYERKGVESVMGAVISDFYGGALYDRGYAVRLHILMLYALDALEPVWIEWTSEGVKRAAVAPLPEESCAFAFKRPDRKTEALLGIIKILE